MMEHVAGKIRLLRITDEMQHGVPQGVPIGGFDFHAGRYAILIGNQISQSSFHYGSHAAIEHAGVVVDLVTVTTLLPEVVFAIDIDIPCVRECRYKSAVAQLRTPTAVVVMQVRAENIVDIFGSDAGGGESLDVRRIQLVE